MLVAEEAVEMLHHSIIVSINGESFRLKDKRKAGIFAPTKNDVTKSKPSPNSMIHRHNYGSLGVAERLAISSASIGTPRLHDWTPCTTHNFSTSIISSMVAPSFSAALM